MPEITHLTRNVRIAPRKMRLVVDKIRHMKVDEAIAVLPTINKRGSIVIAKAVKAAAGAAEDANMDRASLVIQRVWADEGKALKRVIRFSRGRSAMIMKKYSHIGIVLKGEEKVRAKRAPKAAKTATEPVQPEAAQPTTTEDKE